MISTADIEYGWICVCINETRFSEQIQRNLMLARGGEEKGKGKLDSRKGGS